MNSDYARRSSDADWMANGCRTQTRASVADTVIPDPQPDAASIKQEATPRAKAVDRAAKPRGRGRGRHRACSAAVESYLERTGRG